MKTEIISTFSFIKVTCLAAGMGAITLLGAPIAATAATLDADVAQQENGASYELALMMGVPVGVTGSATTPVIELVHCCHAHPIPPYDSHCCHGGAVVVVPAYGYGAVGVRGVSRRTARRTTRRTAHRVNHRRRR
jgi:hypothetical protein